MAFSLANEHPHDKMALIKAPSPLPKIRGAVSLLTYNVLLPNSQDGWWMYKMYPPKALRDRSQANWEHRAKLLQSSIGSADADVVCLQEVSGESFATDFAFMHSLGYTEHALYRKGRFRPATFWKPTLTVKSVTHGDRCLGTTFSMRDDERDTERSFAVVNCHLQAGAEQGARRVRQVVDATESVFKAARKEREEFEKVHAPPQRKSKKNKAKNSPTNQNTPSLPDDLTGAPPRPEEYPIVLCGDLNGGDESAAVRLLEDGTIPKAYEEGGVIVNPKKDKNSKFGKFQDVSTQRDSRTAPPTMVVQELISRLTLESTESSDETDAQGDTDAEQSISSSKNGVRLTPEAKDSLRRIFERFAQGKEYMDTDDVASWLVTINGVLGRGSEFRAAVACMSAGDASMSTNNTSANLYESNEPDTSTTPESNIEPSAAGSEGAGAEPAKPTPKTLPSNGQLTWENFEGIYKDEIKAGKFWGVAHDLHACGCPLQDHPGREDEVFSARYDRVYIGGGLQDKHILAIRDTVCDRACPNEEQGSDHLPVGVVVQML